MLSIIIGVFVLCFVLERIKPGWKLPKVKSWPLRVIIINLVQLGVVTLGGLTWEKYFSAVSFFHMSKFMGPVVGGILAYFVATFVFYWWHRLRHESDFFWLHFHQIHHSPQRLEVITSFYKHPLEMITNSIIGSVLVYVVLGLSVEAGAVYTLATALGEFFYHTNVKTPQWIGLFFQRPEMHRIHHEYQRHKNNYGDIVWWDMFFGTYENPKNFEATCGFDDFREQKLGSMLFFQDVHKKTIKKTTIAITLLYVLTLTLSSSADACSVFAKMNGQDDFVVGKNFDWIPGRGFLIKNPKGMQRSSFYPGKMEWVSKYSSISFTTLGPGFPISSMNQRGLVIETLVDLDGEITQKPRNNLVSLEWAQYVLDSFSTIKEVKEFAKKNPFDQVLEPVHFFICDQRSACAVFESTLEDVRIVDGADLAEKVLANRKWSNDYPMSWKQIFSSNYFSSYKRFHRLAKESASVNRSTVLQIFNVLDKSKITPIVQWQIVWKPIQRHVNWRTFSKSFPGNLHRMEFPEHMKCSLGVTYQDLNDPQKTRIYSEEDATYVGKQVRKMMIWRGKKVDSVLANKIAAHTLQSKCLEAEQEKHVANR